MRSALIAMAALAATGMASAHAAVSQQQPPAAPRSREQYGPTATGALGRRAGRGWTNAQQKRIAKKARNVRRNRAAHRG